MKKIYLGLFIILFTSNIKAQLFEEVTDTPLDSVCWSSIAFTDIDNDNDQDVLITGSTEDGSISKLYTNDGNGNFTEVLGTPFEGIMCGSVAFADVDNDNDQDVLITGATGIYTDYNPIAELYANDGNGNFTEVLETPFDGVSGSSIAFADVDNDNDQDILITGLNSSEQHIAKLYTNDGNGNFTEVLDTPFDGVDESSIAFADIDNDNDQDVLITGHIGGFYNYISKLYTNNGGNFEEVTDTPFEGVGRSSIAFADIDNDGDQDVLITGGNESNDQISQLYTNDGDGNFEEVFDTPFEGVRWSSIAFADVDNDGDQDVLITGSIDYGDQFSELYINDGNGNFTETTSTLFDQVSESSIAFADIDNDNDQDVLITGTSGDEPISKLYRNLTIQVGIDEITFSNEVFIYPNPNSGLINIDLGSLTDVSIKVFSVSGHLIYDKEYITTPIYQFELEAAPGIYILELSAEGEKQQFKMIKQ